MITKYDWTFEPNASSQVKDPNYLYKTPGNKQVNLEVTDINGCVDDTTAIIPYFPVPQLLVIDPGVFVGCEPLDIFLKIYLFLLIPHTMYNGILEMEYIHQNISITYLRKQRNLFSKTLCDFTNWLPYRNILSRLDHCERIAKSKL
ncbi:MAG: PKD domain-containing protein [Saprospiraceae bacterium]|nr:PKD domain-containing protein [Saprospiraceae bacterium]